MSDGQDGEYKGRVENLFDFEGARCHEVVFVFVAPPPDALRGAGPFELVEADGSRHEACWVTGDALGAGPRPLVPDGVLDLVRQAVAKEHAVR